MTDLRIRGLDDELVEALKDSAQLHGRSLESELRYRIEEFARTRVADFPMASDWLREGFDEVLELIPGRQYIASAAEQTYRVTLTRSTTGADPEWNTEIEESLRVDRHLAWIRAIGVGARSHGETPAVALRDCIRVLAKHANAGALARTRKIAEAFNRLPAPYRRIVEGLSDLLSDAVRELHDRSVVIWRTPRHEIYLNIVDAKRGALMVYPLGGNWSVTNGKPMYFPLNATAIALIREELSRLSVLN